MEDNIRTRYTSWSNPEVVRPYVEGNTIHWEECKKPMPPRSNYGGEHHHRRPGPKRGERDREDLSPLEYLQRIKEDLEEILRTKTDHTGEETQGTRSYKEDNYHTGGPHHEKETQRRNKNKGADFERTGTERTQRWSDRPRWDPPERYQMKLTRTGQIEPTDQHNSREGEIIKGMDDTASHQHNRHICTQRHVPAEHRQTTDNTNNTPPTTHGPYRESYYQDEQRNNEALKATQTYTKTHSRRGLDPYHHHETELEDSEDDGERYRNNRSQPTRKLESHNPHLETIEKLWTGPLSHPIPHPVHQVNTNPTNGREEHTLHAKYRPQTRYYTTYVNTTTQKQSMSRNGHTPHNPPQGEIHTTHETHDNTKQKQHDRPYTDAPIHPIMNRPHTHERRVNHPQRDINDTEQNPHRKPTRELHNTDTRWETGLNINTPPPFHEAPNTPITRRHADPMPLTTQRTTPHHQIKTTGTPHIEIRTATQKHHHVENRLPNTQRDNHHQTNLDYQTIARNTRRPTGNITHHTMKAPLDVDRESENDTHLHLIWKAIHAYGKTIPQRDWTEYKRLIHIALNITQQTQRKDRHQTVNNHIHPYRHNTTQTDQTQAHTPWEINGHDTRHPHKTPDTYCTLKTQQPTWRTGVKPRQPQEQTHEHPSPPQPKHAPLHPKHSNNDPEMSTRPHPNNINQTTPSTAKGRISWADLVKGPPTRTPAGTTPKPLATQPNTKKHPLEIKQHATPKHSNTGAQTPQKTLPKHKDQDTPRTDSIHPTLTHPPPTSTLKEKERRQTNQTDYGKTTYDKNDKQNTVPETYTCTQATQIQKHETALTQHWIWKTRKAQNTLTGDRFQNRDHINYYTNMLVGPPAYLTDTQKDTWTKEINKAKEQCRLDILIPALDTKANHWKKRRQEVRPIHNQKEVEIDRIIKHIWHMWEKKGYRNRDISKIFRETNLSEDFIPAPPPPRKITPPNQPKTNHSQPNLTHTPTHTLNTITKPNTPGKPGTPQAKLDTKTLTPPLQETPRQLIEKHTTKDTKHDPEVPSTKRGIIQPPHTHKEQNQQTKGPTHTLVTTKSENKPEPAKATTVTLNRYTPPHLEEHNTERQSPRTPPEGYKESRNTPPRKTYKTREDSTPTKADTEHTNPPLNALPLLKKTGERHPTPIAVETPREHPTLRPRTPIVYTQIGIQAPKPKPKINTLKNKPHTQIDLTMDNSPRASITPRTQQTKEDEIIFYTPIRHTYTPKQNMDTDICTPTRETRQTKTTEKDNQTHTRAEELPTPGDTPQAKQTQHKHTQARAIEEQDTQNHPQRKNTSYTNKSSQTEKTQTKHKATTMTDPHSQKEHVNTEHNDKHNKHALKNTQHTSEKQNPTREETLETQARTQTHKDNTHLNNMHTQEAQINTPKARTPVAKQANHRTFRIQEEEWEALCKETFEDIELDFSRHNSPTRGENTPTTPPPPLNHTLTLTPPNTRIETTHQQTEETKQAKPNAENTQEEHTADTTTDTDTPSRHKDTGHTPPEGHKGTARKEFAPPDETYHQQIHMAIQEAINRYTQAEDTSLSQGHQTPTRETQPTHTTAQTGTKTERNKLRNLRRKYLREQKRIRETTNRTKTKTNTPNTEETNTVFDYTTRGLTQAEREVLSLGKSFIITQNTIDIDRIKTDIATFIRRLRLHYIFRERRQENTQTNQNLTMRRKHTKVKQNRQTHKGIHTQFRKPKSTFQPEETQRDINLIERNIEVNIATQLTYKKRGHPNIPTGWKQAIDTLKQRITDKEITITQADKGGGIIVVDYTTYIDKGTKYIEHEAEAYEPECTPEELIVARLVKEREKVTKQLKELDIIPIDTGTYATHQTIEKITGMKFYYKIHKTTDIHTMPVRPLQSCIGSPTQHISQVLTDLYEPYINSIYIPTYIRDTNHTLYELDGTIIREDDTLAIADVVALYPSIDHEKGLKAIKDFTKAHIHTDEHKAEALTDAFRLVITQNYVKWQGNIYKQTRGVAMGTPVAVTYANIYMNAIDTKLAETCNHIKLHRRFIDDNLFIIPTEKKEEFLRTLNNIDPPSLKYTVTYLGDPPHVETLPFLDIKFYLNTDRELYTRLYTKDTDKHQYLMPHSQHPRHIIRNIPRGVFARIRRLCKEDKAYQEDSELAINWLKQRGYKLHILTQIRQETGMKDRWQMIRDIEDRARKTTAVELTPTLIPFINTYSAPTQGFSHIIHNQQEALSNIFTKAKIKTLNAYRRKQNLGDLLMQPSLRIPIEGTYTTPRNFKKCGKHPHTKPCPCTGTHNQTQCRICAHIDQDNIQIKTKIRRPITCESKNLIYMIWCDTCNIRYIGETQQKLRDRFTQHLRNIDTQDQEFYNHFRTPGHQALHMKIAVLETLQTDEPLYRKIKESTWITYLKTYTPHGLNSKVKESPLDAIKTQAKHTATLLTQAPKSPDRTNTGQQPLNNNTQVTTTTTNTHNDTTIAGENRLRTPRTTLTQTKQTDIETLNTPPRQKHTAIQSRPEHRTQAERHNIQQYKTKTPGRPQQHNTTLDTTHNTPNTHTNTPKQLQTNAQTNTHTPKGWAGPQTSSTTTLPRQSRRLNKMPPQTQ